MPLGDKVEGLRRAIASRSARFGLGPAAKPRGSGRPLPLAAWMLLIGLFGIGVLVYGFWDQQYELIKVLRIQDPVDEVAIAEARNDILRTTLTATAGLAAAAVLLLNFQKQRHEEYNSTQQRIADLRIQAVQQLGSASPSVRIGGLHNLERLGEAHPELRQIVLDEICSYLRLDYAPGTEGEAPSEGANEPNSKGRSAESEVRLIAQEILQRHLKFATSEQRRRYWSHDRLNLKNAKLQNIDFSGCRLREPDFGGAEFTGIARFDGAEFTGDAVFRGAKLAGDADFGYANFTGNADFGYAKFTWDADFGYANFTRNATFMGAEFTGDASFRGAEFAGIADFRYAEFAGIADFRYANFARDAYFRDSVLSRRQDAPWLPVGWGHPDDAEADGTWRLVRASPPEEPDASE